MSTPFVGGVIDFLETQTINGVKPYIMDGETQRWDPFGNPIIPESNTGNWPALIFSQDPGGTDRHYLFGGGYWEPAATTMNVWGTERNQEENTLGTLIQLFRLASTWQSVTQVMQGLDQTVVKVIHTKVQGWDSTQQRDERTAQMKLLYLGVIKLEVRVQGKEQM